MVEKNMCGGYVCFAEEQGPCTFVKEIKHQSEFGGVNAGPKWAKKSWEAYIGRISKVLEDCRLSDELKSAMENIKPDFSE